MNAPAVELNGDRADSVPALEVVDLVKVFPIKSLQGARVIKGVVQAVSKVSFSIESGKTLGLVGESGSGKSTVARCVLQLLTPTSGSVKFNGTELVGMSRKDIQPLRQEMQMVFQDPYASLDPRLTVGNAIAEPLQIHKVKGNHAQRVAELLELVGLAPDHAKRFPHEFSGGQRQRVGIARALALEPQLIVLDEPVSALDVSIQAGVMNLLQDLQTRLGLSYLFIAHDLSVVRHISDSVAVMYLGKVMEVGPAELIYNAPMHPYTQALLSAAPEPDPDIERQRQRIVLKGDVPSPVNPPSGCRFRTRCPKAQDVCADEEPLLVDHGGGQRVACYFPEAVPLVAPTVTHGRTDGRLANRARLRHVFDHHHQHRLDGRHGRRHFDAQRSWRRPVRHVRRRRWRGTRLDLGGAQPDANHHRACPRLGLHHRRGRFPVGPYLRLRYPQYPTRRSGEIGRRASLRGW